MGALKSQSCARGHKMARKNIYLRANGQRECRACSAIRITKWRRLKRLEARVLGSNGPTKPDTDREGMDKSIRVYTSLDEMKNDEYREWQRLQPHERLNAAAELSLSAQWGKESSRNVPRRLQRTLLHFQQPES